MSTLLRIPQDELRSTVGIGGSEVATVLYESPWQSAYELWAIKTGRQVKPPQTDAMKFGIEFEEEAYIAYLASFDYKESFWEKQVAAQHPKLPYLRAIADGWNERERRGIEIKVPSSPYLMESMKRGEVPRYYVLQVAAEMAVFGVDEWDFFVYDAKEKEFEFATVSMQDDFDGMPLGDFWATVAIPLLENFWKAIESDKWIDSDPAPLETDAVNEAIRKYVAAKELLASMEQAKDQAEAVVRRLIGRRKNYLAEGHSFSWGYWKPKAEITIPVEVSQIGTVREALEPIRALEGVKDIKVKSYPDSYRFTIKKINESE